MCIVRAEGRLTSSYRKETSRTDLCSAAAEPREEAVTHVCVRPSRGLTTRSVDQVADVAHPCKPWEVHRRWSELVTEEFFKQVGRCRRY